MYNIDVIRELLDFWFNNPKLWFNCSEQDDILIKNKYEYLLCDDNLYNDIINCYENEYLLLGLIILYDQISRHVFRKDKTKIKIYDLIALELTNKLLLFIEQFNPEERCFILLPLRHTFNENLIKYCLDKVIKWRETSDANIYTRFYYATITSLANINNNKDMSFTAVENFNIDVLDKISTKIIQFNNKDITNTKIYLELKKNMDIVNIIDEPIILSISGGVDSMVCSYLLYSYYNNVKCITINYNNRLDQIDEIIMVNKWLQQLNFEHYVRDIKEIYRTRDKDRDFYEKITRNIRFEAYKKLGKYIILGHNKDDSIENIFSNIKKQKSYDNLLGMDYVSSEQGVTILRPLLNITKKEIIDFALEYNIPFVQDSTPKWSERGLMRDILIPHINNFDVDILDGLVKMAYNFREIYNIYKNCLPNIIFNDNICIVTNTNIIFFDYWRNIINKITLHYGCSHIKNKSIQNMLKSFSYGNKITLGNNLFVKFQDNQFLFHFVK